MELRDGPWWQVALGTPALSLTTLCAVWPQAGPFTFVTLTRRSPGDGGRSQGVTQGSAGQSPPRHVTWHVLSCHIWRPFGLFQTSSSQVSWPLLTLNPGAKLARCYRSLLKLFKHTLFLLPGREEGLSVGSQDGAAGAGCPDLSADHPPRPVLSPERRASSACPSGC